MSKLIEALNDMNGGVFMAKAEAAMKDVVVGVIANDKKGKVLLEFNIEPIDGSSGQVRITHKIAYARPTRFGKTTDEDTRHTVFFANARGETSILPHEQMAFDGMPKADAL